MNRNWNQYFKENSKRVLKVGEDCYRLSEIEKRRISKSIQQFQLGEASEGRLLRAKAKRFAAKNADPLYVETIDFLIKEENRHSAYLGAFMRDQGIPTKRSVWIDGLFRLFRNLANLEVSIRVLVTAEVIALFYYRGLANATGSPVLNQICHRMLSEEREHVRFQMFNISVINLKRFPLFSAWMDMGHCLLLWGTTLMVWKEHKAVLQSEFGNAFEFLEAVRNRFGEALEQGEIDALRALGRGGV